jgi:hypothetical protein
MKVKKLSVSLEAELNDDIREAAQRAGLSVSAWMAEAASAKLRSESLCKFLDEWEQEHGPITAEEMARAREELGWPPEAES